MGSDSETLDGLNVHGAMMDEIHAWKDKNLYDVIVDGTSSREQPMIFMITTAGTIRESVYDMKYEEAEMLLNGLDDPDGYKDDRFYQSYMSWIKERNGLIILNGQKLILV